MNILETISENVTNNCVFPSFCLFPQFLELKKKKNKNCKAVPTTSIPKNDWGSVTNHTAYIHKPDFWIEVVQVNGVFLYALAF